MLIFIPTNKLMLYIEALHIIFVVTWFSGLFYIVRLFVYHSEAEKKEEPEKNILQHQYKIMEKRLWYGITWPSMIGTYIFGFWLAYLLYFSHLIFPAWLILKLVFVFGLTLYHLECHVIFKQLQRGEVKHSSMKLRMWNEVATLFLVSIVFIVVLKNTVSFIWGLAGLLLFSAMLLLAIRIYRKSREKSKNIEKQKNK